jgi:CarD family transcriptional regulator
VLSDGYESNWSRRYQANLDRLASGEMPQVIQVVRDLMARDASRGLSAGEKRMLAKARLILLQEG